MILARVTILEAFILTRRFAPRLASLAAALTALRVTARMKRDWIVAGRRPAGVCAAALLIASRAHGFAKTQNDVTKILRVCGVTVNNRIKEVSAKSAVFNIVQLLLYSNSL